MKKIEVRPFKMPRYESRFLSQVGEHRAEAVSTRRSISHFNKLLSQMEQVISNTARSNQIATRSSLPTFFVQYAYWFDTTRQRLFKQKNERLE